MDKIKQAIINCKRHPEHKINFVNLTNQNWQELCCEECLQEDNQLLKDYISIHSINVCKDDNIFTNWPPVNDPQLLKEIQSAIKSESLTVEILEQQFSQIIKEFTSKLQELKKKMIQQLINQGEKKDQLLKSYNQISAKERLKELTQFKQQSLEAQFKDLKSFISLYQEEKEQNTSFLKQQLQLLKAQQNFIALPLQNMLNQIDLFCQDIYQKMSEKKNEQNDSQINQIFGMSEFCDFSQSNQIKVLENKNESKLSIIKNEVNIYGQVYFKYQLNRQKIYVFRFKFNDKAGNYLIIGLIDENNVNSTLSSTYQGKIFTHNRSNYGGKVVKGKYFHEVEKDFVIEMRIDIENRQIQYLDYPNYQNINQLSDGYELDQNQNYFLAIQFGANESYKTCIDLVYFKEIQK